MSYKIIRPLSSLIALVCLLTNALFFLPFSAEAAGLNVLITVEEQAGISISQKVVSTIVPLPYGAYQSVSNFAIFDSAGVAQPAQFLTWTRWTNKDNSIRSIKVYFLATVPANGTASYYLREGVNPAPDKPVLVSNNASDITVSTGDVSLKISKLKFNLFDSVSVGGALVVDNTDNDGPCLTLSLGGVRCEGNRNLSISPRVYEVKESGPLHVVIAVEAPASIETINGVVTQIPGSYYLIQADAGSNVVRVDEMLLNNPIAPYSKGQEGYGLTGKRTNYTENITRLATTFSNPTFRTVSSANRWSWSELKNNSSDVGVAIIDPFAVETAPNNIVQDGQAIVLRTSPSGSYGLPDMAAKIKTFGVVFRGAAMSDSELNNRAALLRTPPVALAALSAHQDFGTMPGILGGVIPSTVRVSGASYNTLYDYKDEYGIPSSYDVHHQDVWARAHDDGFRWEGSAITGGTSRIDLDSIVQSPSPMNKNVRAAWSELYRKQVAPHYWGNVSVPTEYGGYKLGPDIKTSGSVLGHEASEFSDQPYAYSGSIRSFQGHGISKGDDGAPTKRDDQHGWVHQTHMAAHLGDYIAKYFAERDAEYLKGEAARLLLSKNSIEIPNYQTVGGYPDDSPRAVGHVGLRLALAYALTGDADTLRAIEYIVDSLIKTQQANGWVGSGALAPGFQYGYLSTALIEALTQMNEGSALYAKTFEVLFGKSGKKGIIDAIIEAPFTYFGTGSSSGTSVVSITPVSVGYLWTLNHVNPFTGTIEPKENYLTGVTKYVNGDSGERPYFIAPTNHVWKGEYYGATVPLIQSGTLRSYCVNKTTPLCTGQGSSAPIDKTSPTTPTGVSATVVSSSQINVSWNQSADNVGVSGYLVFRNGTQIASVAGTNYAVTGLSPNTSYTFTIAATDAVGNTSAQSAGVQATTQAGVSTPPQPVPPPSTSTKFNNGDRVITTDVLTVRSSAGGDVVGTQSFGALGTVIGGPVYAQSIDNGLYFWRWKIDYDNGSDGWSAEDFLNVYTGQTTPPPSNPPAGGSILTVGSGKQFATIQSAYNAASDGATIVIDPGIYKEALTVEKNGLTFKAANSADRPHLQWSGGYIPNGKGIMVITGNDTVIDGLEFSGATVVDQNGAGIRAEGANLTVRNSYFHDNEDGILASNNSASQIIIEYSEFDSNGFGDGQSHNLYINIVKSLIFRYNYSHEARVGHELKTRAQENYILYNRLMNESGGTASYEIDLPNGGLTYIIGNLIQQGPATQNPTMISYAAEGGSNPRQEIYVAYNTMVNDLGSGAFIRTFNTPTTVIKNNAFVGGGAVWYNNANPADNVVTNSPGFNNRAGYDYRLSSNSELIGKAIVLNSVGGFSLTPDKSYAHPTSYTDRSKSYDVGAYESGTISNPAPAPTLTGDVNNDSIINALDYSYVLTNFGATDRAADINGDGLVNSLDVSIVILNFGKSK